MQQAWKDIGADTAPSNIPFTTSSEIVNAGDYEMSIGGFGFPDDSQGLMYCSDSVYPQGFNLVK